MTIEGAAMKDLEVRDAMTNLTVTLRPGDTIPYAAKRLLSNRISGAPVVEAGRVVGVVSEVDLLRAYAPHSQRGTHLPAPYPLTFLLRGSPPRDVSGSTVGDVMTEKVVSIGPEQSIFEAAALIDRHGVRRLPVVDDEGYLVGIVARSDLVRCMARSFEGGRATSETTDLRVSRLPA